MSFILALWLVSAAASASPEVTYLLRGDGGRVDCCDAGRSLALDRAGPQGFFRVWTMSPDGANLKCLTCDHPQLPDKHHGNPAWHPSGRYIVFQAADPDLAGPMGKSTLHKIYTNPGAGVQNNVWIMSRDASRLWQVTRLGREEGILHPHFSADGSRMIWAQRVSNEGGIGRWVMKLASFAEVGDDVAVNVIATLTPGSMLFYETHGFSPDGESILFTGMPAGGGGADFDIYTYHLRTAALRQLTDEKLRQWDEHAHFTPDGRHIVWMSSMGSPQPPSRLNQLQLKTDFWIMNADGSDKRQLTFFNHPRSGVAPKHRVIAGDLSISRDGKHLFGYLQDPGTLTRPGSVIRLELR